MQHTSYDCNLFPSNFMFKGSIRIQDTTQQSEFPQIKLFTPSRHFTAATAVPWSLAAKNRIFS